MTCKRLCRIWLDQFQARSSPPHLHPPPTTPSRGFTGHFTFDYRIVNCGKYLTVGLACTCKCPAVGLIKSANYQPTVQERIIAHQQIYFYRICNSSNRFLTNKTATLSRAVYVLLLSSFVRKGKQFAHFGVESALSVGILARSNPDPVSGDVTDGGIADSFPDFALTTEQDRTKP